MAPSESVIVGVDLGGTGSRFLATNSAGEAIASATVLTPSQLEPGEAVGFLLTNAMSVAKGRRIAAIGIGASGPVDGTGVIRNPHTLPAFSHVDLVGALEDALGAPALIDNDAVVAAVAEYHLGAGRGAASLLHVTLGTGIGTALLIEGVPFRGGDGMHPEGGHIGVSTPSTPCYCGRSRCWEQAASRTALQRAAAELLGAPSDDPGAILHLANRAHTDDDADRVFRQYGVALADGLATVIELYRPTVVTVGGSVTAQFPVFAGAVREALGALGEWLSQCDVLGSTLDDLAGARGAALLASSKLATADG
jgi:glucokinase